jgi:hypothetical protein
MFTFLEYYQATELYLSKLPEVIEFDRLNASINNSGSVATEILSTTKPYKILTRNLKKVYTKIHPKLLQTARQYRKILEKYIESKGVDPSTISLNFGGVKSFNSVVSKIITRKRLTLEKMNDLVRATIYFNTQEQVEDFVKDVQRKMPTFNHEVKKKGSDELFGYFGSHHLILVVNGIQCELQVMTRRLEAHKSEAHKIYGSVRDTLASKGKEAVPVKTLRRSKELFSRGNIPRTIHTPSKAEILSKQSTSE